jgi:hypothetical protein
MGNPPRRLRRAAAIAAIGAAAVGGAEACSSDDGTTGDAGPDHVVSGADAYGVEGSFFPQDATGEADGYASDVPSGADAYGVAPEGGDDVQSDHLSNGDDADGGNDAGSSDG